MVRFAPFAVLLLLALPCPVAWAQEGVDSAPSWNRGDRWDYEVTVNGAGDVSRGNLSQEVVAAGPVRLDNRTVDVYTLATRQATRSGGGANSTESTTTYVSRTDLCVLYVNSSSATTLQGLSSRARMELRYNASDGRYRFPLEAGMAWQTDYEITRTIRLDFGQWTDNVTVHGAFTCEGADKIVVPAGRFLAHKVVFRPDGRNTTTYWFSAAVRGEVKREQLDGMTGASTTFVLKKYHREAQPPFLLGTDTGLALVLGMISLGLVAAGTGIYLARKRDGRGRPPEKGPPSKNI
jgi:hypothetical protein